MPSPQIGIFSLGDAAHCYLEFSLLPGTRGAALVAAAASIHEPRTTVGGVNLVIGIRPELWREVAPGDAPADVRSFDEPVVGVEGFRMPATQADLWFWIAGASYDVVFDLARTAIDGLAPRAKLERELSGWSYRHSRDLTGFEDGTENPSLLEAPEVALIPDGQPGAGGSVLLFQKWKHDTAAFHALPVEAQERVIGRTKPDSIELAENEMPRNSHVSRTVIEEDGVEVDIFRRNVPYGTVTDHGTVFVGFSAHQRRLQRMIERMAGAEGGIRDALTRYSTPLTGAYYFVPSVDALAAFAAEDAD
jgi:putative iron-dependent peroxidase